MGESILRFPTKCPMCGRRLPDYTQSVCDMDDRYTPLPEVGRVLRNRYVLERRLGSGGVGTVFKAMDPYRRDLPEDNRHIAIKLLHETTGGGPEILSNLRHEFFRAQALSHRSIVKVYELDRDNDIAFFTMELLEGETLSSALERSPPISIPRSSAWAIILEIGDGLAHAHARNVVHGDLKPQNIMITNSGELRILGFGASQADPRDDLYALACISYELLAGEHPFQRRTSSEARDLGLMARRPSGLTRRQWQTLAMGLSWSREDRSISVREWIVRLIPGQATARRLAQSLARYTEHSVQLTLPSSRAIAMLGILCVALAVCASINRASLDGTIPGQFAAPKTASNTLINADPATRDQNALDGTLLPESRAPRPAPDSEKPSFPPATFAAAVKSDAAGTTLHKGKSNKFSMAADAYRIRSQEHFAEIHVRRSAGYGGDTAFVWWTEPSSAKPGIDYVPQARMTRFLPKGRHSASLFIRIIPNTSRKHTATFYVNIGDPGNGTTVRHLERTAILLPPSI